METALNNDALNHCDKFLKETFPQVPETEKMLNLYNQMRRGYIRGWQEAYMLLTSQYDFTPKKVKKDAN